MPENCGGFGETVESAGVVCFGKNGGELGKGGVLEKGQGLGFWRKLQKGLGTSFPGESLK